MADVVHGRFTGGREHLNPALAGALDAGRALDGGDVLAHPDSPVGRLRKDPPRTEEEVLEDLPPLKYMTTDQLHTLTRAVLGEHQRRADRIRSVPR